jgi:hypothetical protein
MYWEMKCCNIWGLRNAIIADAIIPSDFITNMNILMLVRTLTSMTEMGITQLANA